MQKNNLWVTKVIPIILGVIGALGTAITIYIFFVQSKKTEVIFEIVNSVNAFDVREQIPNLKVYYDDRNILETQNNIRIIELRIRNTGNVDILNNYYDLADPLGFRVQNGELIQVPNVTIASNDYLRSRARPTKQINNLVLFDSFILEENQYVVLKLVILHDVTSEPKIIPVGKIAGMDRIELVTISSREEESFFWGVFKGNALTQLVRALAYFIIVVLITFGIIIIIALLIMFFHNIHSKRLVSEFKSRSGYEFKEIDRVVFKRFVDDGKGFLEQANFLLDNPEKLKQAHLANLEKKEPTIPVPRGPVPRRILPRQIVSEMINDGILTIEADEPKINLHLRSVIKDFVDFLPTKDKARDDKGESENSISTV